ncbi:hypothetical protein SCHPADRAFT_934413 [Schizopora paradoxa]|uniref:ABM domain-containing protein n=1 Tax=Schizopora paradoxa TaxID=27342 RepID=A0A0H2S8L8_9AGAM|nr:hypothetical protein SCHPADRAFT_934413 [Schizopora paradoxa]
MSSSPAGFTKEIIVLVKIEAKPGSEERLVELVAALSKIANSDEEPGCLTFRVVRSGSSFVAFEKYKDADALKKHAESKAFLEFVAAAEELLVEKPTVTYYEELF